MLIQPRNIFLVSFTTSYNCFIVYISFKNRISTTVLGLERKISVRSTKEGLIQRGILLPISPVDEESTDSPRIPPYHSHSDSDHEQTGQCLTYLLLSRGLLGKATGGK